MHSSRSCLLVLAACLLPVLPGCWGEKPRENRSASAAQQRQISASSALIDFVTSQLNDLPSAIALELQPPVVVLDATTSLNRKDVLATLTPLPQTNLPLFNYLSVPEGNAGFERLAIKPGDTIKYYIEVDKGTKQRLEETGEFDGGMVTLEAFDLKVAQVISENAIRIAGGLNRPIAEPHRIEIWRNLDDRMIEINDALGRYASRAEPPIGWEPTADASALGLIIERLNQWIRSRSPDKDWAPDAMLATLDPELANDKSLAKFLSPQALAANQFADHEGRWIQEAIWLRDISRWASGRRRDPLVRAANLFDWTVRNVTLSDDPRLQANRPWQALLYGRGTAAQRAWVFAALCEQLRLKVVVLELPIAAEQPWLWCGLLHEGKLWLFDPQLGLALPGAVQADEQPSVATLAEVQTNDDLLRKLDLESAPYPITASIAKQAAAYVVADGLSLSWRARLLQRQFTGDGKLTLSTRAQAIAEDAAKLDSVSEAKLWPVPFELLRRRLNLGPKTRQAVAIQFRPYAWRPWLWKARVLHLRGMLETAEEAKRKATRRNDALYDAVNDHRTAGQLYMHRLVRPSDDQLAKISDEKRRIYQRAKTDATYWLGLLQYEQQSYRSAQQWLQRMQAMPGADRYTDALNYNQARVLEALGEYDQAAELLNASESLQRHGDRLRAKRLAAKE